MEACILHSYEESKETVTPLSQKRWNTVLECARLWAEVKGHELEHPAAKVLQNEDFREGIVCHKKCVDRFCNRLVISRAQRRMQEETEESEAPPPKRTRAAAGIRDRGTILPEICVICEKKDRWLKRRSKSVRDKLCKAETTDAGNLRESANNKHDDRLLTTIGLTSDCVAREARYHRQCFKEYTRKLYEKVSEDTSKETERYSNTYTEVFRPRVIDRYLIQDKKVYRMTTLARIFTRQVRKHESADIADILPSVVKRRLQRDYPQLLIHSQSKKDGDIVFSKDAICNESDDSDLDTGTSTDPATGSSSESSPLRLGRVHHATPLSQVHSTQLMIRNSVLNHSKSYEIPWPLTSSHISYDS